MKIPAELTEQYVLLYANLFISDFIISLHSNYVSASIINKYGYTDGSFSHFYDHRGMRS